MAEISDVTEWFTISGVQHVARSSDGYWTWTLCGDMCSGAPDKTPPVKLRLCRKCRERLPEATKL